MQKDDKVLEVCGASVYTGIIERGCREDFQQSFALRTDVVVATATTLAKPLSVSTLR